MRFEFDMLSNCYRLTHHCLCLNRYIKNCLLSKIVKRFSTGVISLSLGYAPFVYYFSDFASSYYFLCAVKPSSDLQREVGSLDGLLLMDWSSLFDFKMLFD